MSKGQKSRVRLTAGRVADFACPADKTQAFLWDTDTPSLALRVTPTGRKTYVCESRLSGATVRVNIGTVDEWPIEKARARAGEIKRMLDSGIDPREVERDRQAEREASKAAAAVHAVTVREVWDAYLADRREHWGDRHYQDHVNKAAPGGVEAKRGTRGRKLTVAGPLFPLMELPLNKLDAATVETWAAREAKTRPTSARLSWRLLKAFLSWCAEQPAYAGALPVVNPAKTKKAREALGRAGVKQDALLKEQLPAWFAAVRAIPAPAVAAYLQTLVMTGARPGEVLALRWEDVNTKWNGLTIRDKVEGERVIPLTPYVLSLITALPRRGGHVFASATVQKLKDPTKQKEPAPISKPHKQHATACKVAGIEDLTLHGLRRSFKSLTEWLEIPAGVVAQIMGHKPSATAEKHYTVRPLDLLRVHHERIEAWILEQAGVPFVAPNGTKSIFKVLD